MSGRIQDLENEMTLMWEQIAQIIQKSLSYHNIHRYIHNGREWVPEYLPPTIQFGNVRFTIDQETQSEFTIQHNFYKYQ